MDVDQDEGEANANDNDVTTSSDEGDDEAADTTRTNSLEPTRLQPGSISTNVDEDEPPDTDMGAPTGVYDASCKLHDPPFIKQFPGSAGKIHGAREQTEDETYHNTMGTPGGIYAPFSSRMEWEIAKWAKERGPSSTAFTDLMSIEGVRKNWISLKIHSSPVASL
jgi:hypothetical protein